MSRDRDDETGLHHTALMQGAESNEQIVSLAALQLKIDATSVEGKVCSSDMDAFQNGIDALSEVGMMVMLMVAGKLLQGKPYCITSDNPETIRRCISLAEHMGASIKEIRKDEFVTQLVLVPARHAQRRDIRHPNQSRDSS